MISRSMLQVRLCCRKWQKFVLFRDCVVFHCMYVAHLLVHSSIDGHVGCLHVLAIVKDAAMKIGVHGSL